MGFDEEYWTKKYDCNLTQWDVGQITTPIKEYVDGLTDKSLKILIPGCGNAHEAAYLHNQGFTNITLIDISPLPLRNFVNQYPTFPASNIVHGDFFLLEDQFDLIIEQTFFCALHPSERGKYAIKMNSLLKEEGHLVGLLFDCSLNQDGPPFGGNGKEYRQIFSSLFNLDVFEPCNNSIPPRMGRELFIRLAKK
jgi:methyl halide transferase